MKNFFYGFRYALQGMRYAFKTQINFRFHSLAAIFAVSMGFYFEIQTYEWLWIIAVIAMVFTSELFNTALEVLVDLVSPNYHVKAGIIKDLSSGAVLVTAFFAFITGLLIFIPKIF